MFKVLRKYAKTANLFNVKLVAKKVYFNLNNIIRYMNIEQS